LRDRGVREERGEMENRRDRKNMRVMGDRGNRAGVKRYMRDKGNREDRP